MSCFVAAGQARRRAIVASGNYSVVFDQYGAGIKAVAIAASGYDSDRGHEIVIPAWAVVGALFVHMEIVAIIAIKPNPRGWWCPR